MCGGARSEGMYREGAACPGLQVPLPGKRAQWGGQCGRPAEASGWRLPAVRPVQVRFHCWWPWRSGQGFFCFPESLCWVSESGRKEFRVIYFSDQPRGPGAAWGECSGWCHPRLPGLQVAEGWVASPRPCQLCALGPAGSEPLEALSPSGLSSWHRLAPESPLPLPAALSVPCSPALGLRTTSEK